MPGKRATRPDTAEAGRHELQEKAAKEIQIFTVEDRKALAHRMEQVYNEATARIGVELIEQARHFAAA